MYRPNLFSSIQHPSSFNPSRQKYCNIIIFIVIIFISHTDQYLRLNQKDNIQEKNFLVIMRKTLVLDLDNTLVASFSTSKQQLLEVCDLVVTVAREKFHDTLKIAVFKRPYLDEFLEVACSLFDVWIFTASDKSYAQPVCEQLLNSKSRFKGCLFRESLSKGIKDLSIFNVSMDQIMIIDDDEYNFQLQPNSK